VRGRQPGLRGRRDPAGQIDRGLAAALVDPRAEVRAASLEDLRRAYLRCEAGRCATVGAVARSALPALAGLLASGDPAVRVFAAQAIGFLACDAGGLAGALGDALDAGEGAVRLAVLDAIGELGPAGAAITGAVLNNVLIVNGALIPNQTFVVVP
jgi:hypothetical protein